MTPSEATVGHADLIARARQLEANASFSINPESIAQFLIPPSKRRHEFAMKRWKRFLCEILQVNNEDAPPFDPVPPLWKIKLFLDWYIRESKGLIAEEVCDLTLWNRVTELKRAIKLYTDHCYTKRDNDELRHYIFTELPRTANLTTQARAKPVATLEVAEDLLKFLWCCDEYQYSHPRVPLQLHFAILLLLYIGLRPGEMVESKDWVGSNEGLLYRDVELAYLEFPPVYSGYVLYVTLRNRKGRRGNNKNIPTMVLTEDPEHRHLCPVTAFLSLALADSALKGCATFGDVEKHRPMLGSKIHRYGINTKAGNTPVLRASNPDGTISDNAILKHDCLNNFIKGLGERSGYQEQLSAYCFRRGYGHSVQKSATPAQLKQLMGHAGESTFQYYISQIIGIDTQAMVLGTQQRLDLIELNCSMMLDRNPLAPQRPGSLLSETSLPSVDLAEVRAPHLSSAQQFELRRQMRHKMHQKNRKDFFDITDKPRQQNTEDDMAYEIPNALIQRTPSRFLRAYLKHDQERREVMELFFPDEENKAVVSLQQVLVPLSTMARTSLPLRWYLTTMPQENDCCKDCGKKLDRKRPGKMNHHLLRCAQQRHIARETTHIHQHFEDSVKRCSWGFCNFQFRGRDCKAYTRHIDKHLQDIKTHQCLWRGCGFQAKDYQDLALHLSVAHDCPNEWTIPTRAHYCFEHGHWMKSDYVWEKHLEQEHLSHLNGFCGMIRRHGLVVVAAHCPFCLASVEAPLRVRFQQFDDSPALHRHIKKHLVDAPLETCPHPTCGERLGSEDKFWTHVHQIHGIPTPSGQGSLKRKQRDEDGEDLTAGEARGEDSANRCAVH